MHRNSLIGAASVREFRELEHQWRLKSEGIVPGPPNLDGLSIEEPPDVDFPTLDVQREWIRALTDSIRRDIGIMNVSDEEAPHLKQWVVQRLTDMYAQIGSLLHPFEPGSLTLPVARTPIQKCSLITLWP